MQLTTLLMIAVGILTFLSGLAVLVGTAKEKRMEGIWYFILTTGTAVWGVAIGVFLALPTDATDLAAASIAALYSGATFMLSGFVGYTGWRYKIGKFFSILATLGAIALSTAVITQPSLLYPEIVLSHMGNSITPIVGPYYLTYAVYCIFTALLMLGFTLFTLGRSRQANERAGLTVLLVGTSIAAIFISIFDLFLPIIRYDLIWIGPLATSINILCFYYEILKYRLIPVNTSWLRILSYIILTAVSAIIYMVVFFLVFTALFHGATPSVSIVILNFTMILTFMLLAPAYNELTGSIRSQISTSTIDLTYVVKKLTNMSGKVDLNELSAFLADHLHFQYVSILIGNRLYGSRNIVLTTDVISTIQNLKEPDHHETWTPLPATAKNTLNSADIKAIAEIRDASGHRIGQVLFGKSTTKTAFEHRTDLNQIEMVLGLVENIINAKTKKRK